ncbi:1-acyl-sn-glycerol-3-phosphate acyltransferase [Streptomyces sp. NBC_00513]|uniref:lysophospholipid acyltransferase family protein n=1 Tax=unclassified Streptomyces TaxID=2593676 RepID=UPI00131B3138|nr:MULTISPECIES: lysophospholipid acyltransferase family protein [unclassified Streptomyces]MCX5072301.1 1-acyl-sn-glycerol-3-phosphate acyltransferase [Streptomyces sp. NBC_00424]WUD44349.1 1-acyl-sn-glycerol-3-phosphate acyltransferase [Streptomyces sp. NBC_00513]
MNAWLPTAPCTPEACAGHEGPAASVPHAVLRLAGAVALVLLAVLTAAPVRLLPDRPRHALVRSWSAALVASLGIRITVHGNPGAGGGRLIVANHISWLDIPLVAAVLPCRMLAKSEIGAWPVLGRLAARAGTLFIERDRIRTLPDTVATLTRALLAGDRVTVFPEGSTWCGRAQGPFRRAAFQSALDAGVPVQPIRLAYRLSGGAEPAGSLAGAPAFVGDDPLTASLWRIARARGVRAEVWLLPRIPPGRHEDRRDLAAAAQEAVHARAARPVPAARPVHTAEPVRGARPVRTAPLLPGIPTQAAGPCATDRDNAKRPAASVHHWVNSSPADASSSRTPS